MTYSPGRGSGPRSTATIPARTCPTGWPRCALPQDLDRRADACACYPTQLGFQFGGVA
ncbi:MAG: hypothetical protein M3Q47_08695 [Actinomycetota bacterium]|nr:hypothetical protein [Actinomycetota bacterium]